MALKKTVVSSAGSGNSSTPLGRCKLSEKYPTLVEFVSLRLWEDGAPRQTGTITLLFDAGMLKAALHDRDAGLSAFASGSSLTSLLDALEKGLADQTLEWREKKDYPQGGRTRKGPGQ